MQKPQPVQATQRVPIHPGDPVIRQRHSHQLRTVPDRVGGQCLDPIARQIQSPQLGEIVKGGLGYALEEVVAELDVAQLDVHLSEEDTLRQVVQPVGLEVEVAQSLEGVEGGRLDGVEVVVVEDEPVEADEGPESALGKLVGGEGEAELEDLEAVVEADESLVGDVGEVVEREAQLLQFAGACEFLVGGFFIRDLIGWLGIGCYIFL